MQKEKKTSQLYYNWFEYTSEKIAINYEFCFIINLIFLIK